MILVIYMDLLKDKYVIVEIIPTALSKDKGDIVEMTALKLDGIKLVDRFNCRLNKEKVVLKEFLDMCSYDDEAFIYFDTTKEILDKFEEFVGDLPILIIDNTYTLNYLSDLSNSKELVFPYLDLEFNDLVIQNMIDKYQLEASNYMVDLVFEAIIRK